MLDGGIDKLVDQKADAYRGNPQALQQSYAKNQELMDLLAMQKLKAEKDAAARDTHALSPWSFFVRLEANGYRPGSTRSYRCLLRSPFLFHAAF